MSHSHNALVVFLALGIINSAWPCIVVAQLSYGEAVQGQVSTGPAKKSGDDVSPDNARKMRPTQFGPAAIPLSPQSAADAGEGDSTGSASTKAEAFSGTSIPVAVAAPYGSNSNASMAAGSTAEEIKQPDGSVVRLRFQGSPVMNWYEDEHGYTVVRYRDTYCYARVDARGELVPDPKLVVGKVDPSTTGLKSGLRPSRAAIMRRISAFQNWQATGGSSRQASDNSPLYKPGTHAPGTYVYPIPGTNIGSSAAVGKFDPQDPSHPPLSAHAVAVHSDTTTQATPKLIDAILEGKAVRLIQLGDVFLDSHGRRVFKDGDKYVYADQTEASAFAAGTLEPSPNGTKTGDGKSLSTPTKTGDWPIAKPMDSAASSSSQTAP